jgi:hypothetical protein
MSNRIVVPQQAIQQAELPARVRIAGVLDGVPTEMSDRRAISIFAMFTIDEPEDRHVPSVDDGLVAFLPEVCATSSRSRSR